MTLKLFILAALFVISGGAAFSEHFKAHKSISLLATTVAIIATFYLLQDIYDDLRQPSSSTQHEHGGDYPETLARRLTYADIAGKSKRELRMMRNEIYARHGYRFGKYDLQTNFENKSWYKPTTANGINLYNNHFTQIERYNVKFIKQYE